MAQGLCDANQTAEHYGDYVITRQLAVEQNVVIYRARKHDAPPTEAAEKYVVILMRGSDNGPEAANEASSPNLAKDLQLNFIEGVKEQKKALESGALNIVPVHDFGIVSAGAWYATDYYPRGFLKKWISQRAGVSEEELRHIISSTVKSLLTLQQHCKRSHGNLAPSSILIGGKIGASLREAPIILTYLAPGGENDANRFELSDLQALGQIIYMLVCRQNFTSFNLDDYPIAGSEHWSGLGKEGTFWLGVCNRLLDPGLTLENFSLKKLAGELDSKSNVPSKSTGAILAILALLAAGVVFFYLRFKTPPLVVNRNPITIARTPTSSNGAPEKIDEAKQDSQASKTGVIPIVQPPPTNAPPTISQIEDQIVKAGEPVVNVDNAYATPILAGISDRTVKLGTTTAQYPFQIGTNDSAMEKLFVVSASANPSYLPDSALKIGGSGANRLLIINPVPQQTGEVILAITVANSRTNVTATFWFRVEP